MEEGARERRWFWATLILSSVTIVAFVFGLWELLENHFFRDIDYATLHYLYITRGVASSMLLAFWAAWFVLRQRQRHEEELRRSREHYRGLLEASPGAVALYDAELRVTEWNATAERLYGFSKEEVVGQTLPTVPPARMEELRELLQRVEKGDLIQELESMRQNKNGVAFEVQLNLLPYRQAGGQKLFLEVTSDIRERVRMRQKMLEIEKLTSMGRMAAGTAHHLNTPLAAMLLRLQMMRARQHHHPCEGDLERMEVGVRVCQHFVQRLLEFSRRPAAQKQPEEIAPILHSVVSFLSPSLLAKRACLSLDTDGASGALVLADRNQIEALFLALLSNALDAIEPEGRVTIRCREQQPGWVEVQIQDNGCGIAATDFPRVFEPFFTSKAPGKGTGLGLAIARNIALEHGGTIHLESAPKQGTTAIVQLPLYRAGEMEKGK